MNKIKGLVFLASIVFISSCSDDESVQATLSEYYLVGDFQTNEGVFSRVATFNATSKSVTNEVDLDFRLLDGVVNNEELYGISVFTTSVLNKVDLVTGDKQSIELSLDRPKVDFHNNEIIVAGVLFEITTGSNIESKGVISIYNRELETVDEIDIGSASQIFDLLITDDQVFISYADGTSGFVKSYDLSTKGLVQTFLAQTPFQLYTNDRAVFAFTFGGYYTLDSSVSGPTFQEVLGLSVDIGGTRSIAFGESNNFYFFLPTAQPAPVPYFLSEYVIDSNAAEELIVEDLRYLVRFPLDYDAINNVILVNGGDNTLKVVSPNGVNRIEVELPFKDLNFILKK